MFAEFLSNFENRGTLHDQLLHLTIPDVGVEPLDEPLWTQFPRIQNLDPNP